VIALAGACQKHRKEPSWLQTLRYALEVLSQDEKYWWQARKVGSIFDSDGVFAKPGPTGLIPSTKLLESRILSKLNQTTHNRSMANFHSPQNKRKKAFMKKSKSATFSTTSLQLEKTARLNNPYLEMIKFSPKDMMRRPMIIIGPRSANTTDLREKLFESNSSLYQIPVPHTSRKPMATEVDGKDYHFCSKNHMEKLINQDGVFVEWGEYNDNFYGTSIDAVRSVRFNGKVCLMSPMNLSQALPKLYSAGIQSFVIFIDVDKEAHTNGGYQSDGLNQSGSSDAIDAQIKSAEMFKKFHQMIDRVIKFENHDQVFKEIEAASFSLLNDEQWVPRKWMP